MQTPQFWQATASALLARHYGLTLNDTDITKFYRRRRRRILKSTTTSETHADVMS